MDSSYNYHNLCNVGISNVDPCAIYFNDGTSYDEKSNTKLLQLINNTLNLTTNFSSSTALGSQENDIISPPNEQEPLNPGFVFDFTQFEDSQPMVDIGFSPAYKTVKGERATVSDTHLFSTASNTESTASPMQTAEETPRTEGSEESDYNGGMEEEEETAKKSEQSKYKNKPKELIERAEKVVKTLLDQTQFDYMNLLMENMKSDNRWAEEGEELELLLVRHEELATSTIKSEIREAKEIKRELLQILETKQYSHLAAGLNDFIDEIRQLGSEVITNFNKDYKNKISNAFFKKDLPKTDLFSWMLLVLIALNILPEEYESPELLPLKKSTVCMAVWLFESPMKKKNKDLYKDPEVRGHLRVIMTEMYNNLFIQAAEKLDENTLGLLQRISNSLGTRFANVERPKRPQKRVVRARASPRNFEFDNGLTGKRGSSRAPVLSDVTTKKKVNKQKK